MSSEQFYKSLCDFCKFTLDKSHYISVCEKAICKKSVNEILVFLPTVSCVFSHTSKTTTKQQLHDDDFSLYHTVQRDQQAMFQK